MSVVWSWLNSHLWYCSYHECHYIELIPFRERDQCRLSWIECCHSIGKCHVTWTDHDATVDITFCWQQWEKCYATSMNCSHFYNGRTYDYLPIEDSEKTWGKGSNPKWRWNLQLIWKKWLQNCARQSNISVLNWRTWCQRMTIREVRTMTAIAMKAKTNNHYAINLGHLLLPWLSLKNSIIDPVPILCWADKSLKFYLIPMHVP